MVLGSKVPCRLSNSNTHAKMRISQSSLFKTRYLPSLCSCKTFIKEIPIRATYGWFNIQHDPGKTYAFHLAFPSYRMLIAASSGIEREEWISSLKVCK